MNEMSARILLGIYRGESIPEIASAVGRVVSTVHEAMTWMRDQGYIKPWSHNKIRGKELTEDGIKFVCAYYGENALRKDDGV